MRRMNSTMTLCHCCVLRAWRMLCRCPPDGCFAVVVVAWWTLSHYCVLRACLLFLDIFGISVFSSCGNFVVVVMLVCGWLATVSCLVALPWHLWCSDNAFSTAGSTLRVVLVVLGVPYAHRCMRMFLIIVAVDYSLSCHHLDYLPSLDGICVECWLNRWGLGLLLLGKSDNDGVDAASFVEALSRITLPVYLLWLYVGSRLLGVWRRACVLDALVFLLVPVVPSRV